MINHIILNALVVKKKGYKKYRHNVRPINNQHLHTFMEITHV